MWVPDLIDRIALLEGINVEEGIENSNKVINKYLMPDLVNSSVDSVNGTLTYNVPTMYNGIKFENAL